MGEMRYCPNCKKNTYTTLDINWIIFVILLIFGIILGLVYLLYCYYKKNRCGICGCPAEQMFPPRYDCNENNNRNNGNN